MRRYPVKREPDTTPALPAPEAQTTEVKRDPVEPGQEAISANSFLAIARLDTTSADIIRTLYGLEKHSLESWYRRLKRTLNTAPKGGSA